VEATVHIDGRPRQITGYDLTPKGIIEHLDLLKPQYEPTARWGHFGNGFAWDA
jgi:S-adenosylmethionine synthetase